ncbi:hypothetical protein FB451DRAFT_1405885 [Mycena latifolia]|nr:hypothetical protein FB451DRAFT_1405885 [Mycena latifolia]
MTNKDPRQASLADLLRARYLPPCPIPVSIAVDGGFWGIKRHSTQADVADTTSTKARHLRRWDHGVYGQPPLSVPLPPLRPSVLARTELMCRSMARGGNTTAQPACFLTGIAHKLASSNGSRRREGRRVLNGDARRLARASGCIANDLFPKSTRVSIATDSSSFSSLPSSSAATRSSAVAHIVKSGAPRPVSAHVARRPNTSHNDLLTTVPSLHPIRASARVVTLAGARRGRRRRSIDWTYTSAKGGRAVLSVACTGVGRAAAEGRELFGGSWGSAAVEIADIGGMAACGRTWVRLRGWLLCASGGRK